MITFTPLESLVACSVRNLASIRAYSGDLVDSTLRKDWILLKRIRDFGAICKPSRWKVEETSNGVTL